VTACPAQPQQVTSTMPKNLTSGHLQGKDQCDWGIPADEQLQGAFRHQP